MYLLHGFYTQNTLKTLYVLEETGVDYDFNFVNLSGGEQREESFLKKAPIGKVPVLEHKGQSLFESGAICRYIANAERSGLYPAEPMQRAQVDQWLDFFTCHLGKWLNTMYFEQIIKPAIGMGDPDPAAIAEAEKWAHQQLGVLDKILAENDWLANDAMSIADLSSLAYVEQAHMVNFPLDNYSNVRAWLNRLETLESVGRARAIVQPYMPSVGG